MVILTTVECQTEEERIRLILLARKYGRVIETAERKTIQLRFENKRDLIVFAACFRDIATCEQDWTTSVFATCASCGLPVSNGSLVVRPDGSVAELHARCS